MTEMCRRMSTDHFVHRIANPAPREMHLSGASYF